MNRATEQTTITTWRADGTEQQKKRKQSNQGKASKAQVNERNKVKAHGIEVYINRYSTWEL